MFTLPAGPTALATIDVGSQGVAGGFGQVKIGASRGVAESSCSFTFDQNCTDGVECLCFNPSVFEDFHDVDELLRTGREDTHDHVSLRDFVWRPFQLLTDIG